MVPEFLKLYFLVPEFHFASQIIPQFKSFTYRGENYNKPTSRGSFCITDK